MAPVTADALDAVKFVNEAIPVPLTAFWPVVPPIVQAPDPTFAVTDAVLVVILFPY